jgi:hypothetical protein
MQFNSHNVTEYYFATKTLTNVFEETPLKQSSFKTALLKDTPKPLRVFFYPACHLPALTGGVIFGTNLSLGQTFIAML